MGIYFRFPTFSTSFQPFAFNLSTFLFKIFTHPSLFKILTHPQPTQTLTFQFIYAELCPLAHFGAIGVVRLVARARSGFGDGVVVVESQALGAPPVAVAAATPTPPL